ncbi:MAG TPA: ATP synthase F1 subunit gamma [Candidatus Paceibacterota bacterium]
MAGLKQIKSKIRSVEKTRKVTKAMEAVSAAKMRKAQQRALSGRAYARAAMAVLSRVAGSKDLARHPLTHVRSVARATYIVVTADRGLAGALNSAVLRAVEKDIAAQGLSQEHISIIAVGRKANDYFARRGYTIEIYHPHNAEELSSELMHDLIQEAAGRFGEGQTDTVKIAYQHFITTFEQRPTVRTIFPLSIDELREVVDDIVPARGKFSEARGENGYPAVTAYTVEPTRAQVFDVILPKLASVFVYHALLESQASEHSARMVAMKSATDKGAELQHALTLKFNKARQAAITREVSEITGGMEAMAG